MLTPSTLYALITMTKNLKNPYRIITILAMLIVLPFTMLWESEQPIWNVVSGTLLISLFFLFLFRNENYAFLNARLTLAGDLIAAGGILLLGYVIPCISWWKICLLLIVPVVSFVSKSVLPDEAQTSNSVEPARVAWYTIAEFLIFMAMLSEVAYLGLDNPSRTKWLYLLSGSLVSMGGILLMLFSKHVNSRSANEKQLTILYLSFPIALMNLGLKTGIEVSVRLPIIALALLFVFFLITDAYRASDNRSSSVK